LAAERKRAQGELANRVEAQRNLIRTQRVSYQSFRSGKSVKRRAPGVFVSRG
jgi:putative transposase